MLDFLLRLAAGDRADELIPLQFGFNVAIPGVLCVLLLVATGVGVALLYRWRVQGLRAPVRVFVVTARTIVAVVIVFLLLDPSILAERIRPGEQFVVMLFDDSQSMRLAGDDGLSRGQRMVNAYTEHGPALEDELSQVHQLAQYRVGGSIEPLQSVEALEFGERESDLSGAVRDALRDLEGTHVSAAILFSDGVQQAPEPQDGEEASAEAPGVPVYTVGVDNTSTWSDVEISDISVQRSNFDKSPVVLTVDARATGLAGHTMAVEARQGVRTVKQKTVSIEDDSQESEVRLEFVPDRDDWIHYTARVRISDENLGEDADQAIASLDRISENNSRGFVVDNRQKEYRILYVSGRPNWQHKFVRRALAEDDQLFLTGLVCISNADPKFEFRGEDTSLSNPLFEGFEEDDDRPRYDEPVFLRFNLKDEHNELVSGYPTEETELFDYELVIWGDVDRELFKTAQLELTRDFVERRGGSMLFLGGPSSFTEGNYEDTLIENMLPVLLHPDDTATSKLRVKEPFTVSPTMEGVLTGAWTFEAERMKNEQRWQEMPELFGLNRFPLVRPGATIMAEAYMKGGEGPFPLFVSHRYGEGRTAVMATADTWQWQMRLDHEDSRHERLWRQTVRELVKDVPTPIVLRNARDAYTQGTPARFELIVRDDEFVKREGLRTTVTLVKPDGAEEVLPVEESIEEPGLYVSEFVPQQTGQYLVKAVVLDENEELVGNWERGFVVEADKREFQNAQYNPDFLRRMAQNSGGKFISLSQLPEMAEQIPMPKRMDAETVVIHLWHLPIFFLLLAALLPLEWYVRRRHGQP